MNIHEHQAKQLLKKFGAIVPNGEACFTVQEVLEKAKKLNLKKYVLKAQIHAGGRGKAGGVKILDNLSDLEKAAKDLLGKKLITHQTGPSGKEVKRLYLEEPSNIKKEFYLSCLIDRASSKIAFISSDQGGMDIEEVAKSDPNKINTVKISFKEDIEDEDCKKIIHNFNLDDDANLKCIKIIKSIYKTFVSTDASLIEINPLILTKENNIVCLDAKISFDDNAIFKHPELLELRDLNEEDPTEIEASKHDLAYIKLDGSIGCMVNGAGLAMGTMDTIKFFGGNPANFLDVGGTATQERVAKAFKIILKDPEVKVVLVNIFGGIVRCDLIAEGIVAAIKEVGIEVPVVVRLEGNNAEIGAKILEESDIKVESINDLGSAAKKSVELAK